MPKRTTGWPERLVGTIERHRLEPFVWGRSDCALFAADCAVALTGVDPIPVGSRGAYDDEAGAVAMLERCGYGDIEEAAGRAFREVPPAQARRGDWVVIDVHGRPTLGVLCGSAAAMKLVGGWREHLCFFSRSRARRAWAVGW